MWGQADSTYAALAAGGLYHLILRRHWRACVFFAIALGFKLQIIFLFPVLLLLALRKWLPWRALLAIPVVYLLLDVPALLLGAYWRRLLLIYLHQADRYNELSINAPTIYTFLPADPALRRIGVAVTGLVLLGLIGLAVWRRVEITPARIVLFSSLSVLLTPFLLPSMHERYFYLADVLTVVTALWFASRALIAVPLLVQLASLSCYLNYLLKPYRWAERTGNAIPPVYEHGYWSARWLLSFPHLDLRILSACVAIAIGLTFSFVLAERHKSELERQVAAQIS
jgi:Gpi18-like mannosyltransferase